MVPRPSRRTLLTRGAAVVAAAGLGRVVPLLAASPQAQSTALGQNLGSRTPLPVRLGVASYTFRQFDPAHVIDFMHTLRTPYLNVKDVHLPMGSAAEVRQHADVFRRAGVQLTAAGTIYFEKVDDADIRAKFEYCKAAGIPLIVGAPTHAVLSRVERFVKEYDIRLAIHNHGPEDKEWPSPLDVLQAVGRMDARIGCCVDVGHTMRAGVDVIEALKRAGPRLFDIHMKDLAQRDAKDSQVAVGEGIMPVRAIFSELMRMQYKGYVDLEYEIKPDDPLPGVEKSFAFMRGVLRELGYTTPADTAGSA